MTTHGGPTITFTKMVTISHERQSALLDPPLEKVPGQKFLKIWGILSF